MSPGFETGFDLSVVVATYQRPGQTEDLVRSLRSSVRRFRRTRETDLQFECLVCCTREDETTVGTLEVVEWPELTVITTDRRAAGYNRDVGFRRAEGTYVAVVDSDCIVADDWVASVHDALREHEFPDALQGAYYHDYRPERTWYTRVEADEDRSRFEDGQADSRNLVLRRSTYFDIGGYDSDHLYADAAEDLVLRRRIEDAGGTFEMAEGVDVYHRYPATVTGNLRRYNRYGRGAIHVKRYYPGLYDQFSPAAFVASTLADVRSFAFDRDRPVTGRELLYRLLKTVAFLVGFVQGLFVYRREESRTASSRS